MSNYPANLSPTDEHWNPKLRSQNDIDVERESICSEMKSEGADGMAEVLMHYEGRETYLIQKLRNEIIDAAVNKGIDPADLCLRDVFYANKVSFIGILELKASYKYRSPNHDEDSRDYKMLMEQLS